MISRRTGPHGVDPTGTSNNARRKARIGSAVQRVSAFGGLPATALPTSLLTLALCRVFYGKVTLDDLPLPPFSNKSREHRSGRTVVGDAPNESSRLTIR
jgi:hypothetical protein